MKSDLLRKALAVIISIVLAYVFLYEGIWVWVIENTDVPANKMVILVAKTGTDMPAGQIIAEKGQKGVLREPLGPGRHFINPFLYERHLRDQIVIGGGEVGIVINKFGKELPPGEFLAGPEERGIQRDVLMAGSYKLNPYAYEVKVIKMAQIMPGYVGVATARSGKPSTNQLADAGERGVQKAVMQPGSYPLNPEAYSIEPIEIGFNQITMAHAGRLPEAQTSGEMKQALIQQSAAVLSPVKFPSSDGFEITIDVTVLWQLLPQDAPTVVARYGNIKKIEENILIPQINSTARIKGSTFGAVDFIVGDKREEFQTAFQATIESTLHEKRLQVDLALVQDTLVPDNLSGPIQDARVAAEWNITNVEKTRTEAKKAELDENIGRIRQVEQVVEFETQRLEGNTRAEQEKQVNEIAAQTRLLVADLDRQTAAIYADTRRKIGAADAQVVELKGKAEGDGYRQRVQAAGGPADFTAYEFSKRLPTNLKLGLIYAGAGTLWTDLKKASDVAPLAILQQGADTARQDGK